MTTKCPKKLLDLSKEEQLAFLESFDVVFCDVDGVLWTNNGVSIDGTPEGIRALRNLKKKIYFTTNNSTNPMDMFLARTKKFEVVNGEVVRPSVTLVWYLKKIKFDKEIYVVGFEALKNELKEAGFKVVSDEMSPTEERADAIVKEVRNLRPNVGAVIIDFAVNMHYMALQKCVEYLMKQDALFLVGAIDPVLPFRGSNLIGASHFIKIVEEVSGKKPILLAKPGKDFNGVLQENLGPFDRKRVLVIGDSPVTDMAFATDFGYQKLLPLTGFVTEQDLTDWQYEERYKPDFVVESIKDLDTVVNNLGLNKPKL